MKMILKIKTEVQEEELNQELKVEMIMTVYKMENRIVIFSDTNQVKFAFGQIRIQTTTILTHYCMTIIYI